MPSYLLDARAAATHFPGIGRYVSNLTRELAARLEPDEALWLLVDSRRQAGWPLPEPVDGRVRWIDAPFSLFSPTQQWQIPRLLNRLRPTLYHTPYYLTPLFVRPPAVLTCYDAIPLRFPESTSPRARALFKLFHGLALKRARQVIAISEWTRQDLGHYFAYPAGQVTVIPLAADPRFRPPDEAETAALRGRCQLEDPFVLYLGINKPHKNLVRLVAAWEQVRTEAHLVIAGAWDDRYPEVRREIDARGLAGRVRLLGPVADEALPALYGAAELFVFPSLYEGFGLPVVEAMACGTPVACSYASSLPEVGGLAAAYFNPEAVDEIAATLQRLLDLPEKRRELSAAGRIQAARFTWGETAARTLDLYRAMAPMD